MSLFLTHAAIVLLSLVWLLVHILLAPEGWQDSDGFHFL